MSEMYKLRSIERVKERRIALGLSYQRLADKTGMSKSTLQRYEAGTIKNLPADKLGVLAAALETTPAYLMGWDESDNKPPINEEQQKIKEDFLRLIKKRSTLLEYCGINIDKLSETEIENLAEDILTQMTLVSYKYKR